MKLKLVLDEIKDLSNKIHQDSLVVKLLLKNGLSKH